MGKDAQVKIHGDMQGHSPQAWSPVIQVKDNHQKKTCGKCLKDVIKMTLSLSVCLVTSALIYSIHIIFLEGGLCILRVM